ncbi:hypothetical protein [Luteimonas sp. FCS-9]|uniref:hypothetical protein n=1 Tax=Luteimonas sp. FCS-9 TaxID=1547516 RepID=UPI00069AD911|nr:hypothetical protein [Luteimonas sp. FCS-9]
MRTSLLTWMLAAALAPSIGSATEALRADLSLPETPMFTGPAAFGDGEYTGPRTATPAWRRHRDKTLVRRGGCPTAPDGQERAVTGSVSTGIGHSSRGGTSHWNAADLNLCRERDGEAGGTMNLNLRVARYDGPGGYYGMGPGLGYGPYDGFDGIGDFGPTWRDLHGPWPGGRGRTESWSEGRQPWR